MAIREKGSLPRAYWRIDPNLDQTHEQPGEMVRLICAGGRQPRRGRFKNRTAFYGIFGQGPARRALQRGDVVDHVTAEDCAQAPEHVRFCTLALPHLYVDGWDEWQESDLEVGARMRRLRARKRRNAVTPQTDPEPVADAVTPLRQAGTELAVGAAESAEKRATSQKGRYPIDTTGANRVDPMNPAVSEDNHRNAVTTGVRRQASGEVPTPTEPLSSGQKVDAKSKQAIIRAIAEALTKHSYPSLDRGAKSIVASQVGDLLRGGWVAPEITQTAIELALDWEPKRGYSKLLHLAQRQRAKTAEREQEEHARRKREERNTEADEKAQADLMDPSRHWYRGRGEDCGTCHAPSEMHMPKPEFARLRQLATVDKALAHARGRS